MPPLFTAIVEPLQVPEVIIPTVAMFAKVVMFGSVVVADKRLSKRSFVQNKLDPSVMSIVLMPNEEVATRA